MSRIINDSAKNEDHKTPIYSEAESSEESSDESSESSEEESEESSEELESLGGAVFLMIIEGSTRFGIAGALMATTFVAV